MAFNFTCICNHVGALDHTTEWIKASIEEATRLMPPADKSGDSDKGKKSLPGPILVLNTAYIKLLTSDESKGPLPEVGKQTHTAYRNLSYHSRRSVCTYDLKVSLSCVFRP